MGRGLPKKYAAMGFKKGWTSYKASKSKRKASSSTKRKKGVSKTGKKKSGRKGNRIIGNLGLRGLVAGSVVLAGTKYLVRRFAPQVGAYTTAAASLGAGAVGHVLGTGKSLAQFGAVDGLSELIFDLISPGGLVTIPGYGAEGAAPGGYDC